MTPPTEFVGVPVFDRQLPNDAIAIAAEHAWERDQGVAKPRALRQQTLVIGGHSVDHHLASELNEGVVIHSANCFT